MRKIFNPIAVILLGILISTSFVTAQPGPPSGSTPPLPDLGPDTGICPGSSVTLNPFASYQLFEDTLIIRYNATQGVSGLQNANKVYIHSTYELQPFGGPVNPWIGNWGQDDSLGLMTETSPDQWEIRLYLPGYYNFSPGTNINGLFMVFRNEDGTATGKDDNDNDIFLLLSGTNPSSAFSGVQGIRVSDGVNSIQWSTGATTPSISVNAAGTYGVAVNYSSGSVGYDTIVISTAGGPSPSLGNDIISCNSNLSITLDPGNNFNTYLWSTGSTDSSIIINTAGTYWVETNSGGCISRDSITIIQSAPATPISLGNDTLLCGAGLLVLDPGIQISPAGDSLTIVYDATQGQSTLIGASKVYMHSGIELVPFGGWTTTIGNWGQDDGIGQMDSIGPNLWSITINVQNYYSLSPGQNINGILMVFRNADGTATGKDQNGNDIFLNMSVSPPTSPFNGINPTFTQNPYTSILWSDSSSANTLTVSAPGTYFAIVNTTGGCTLSDTVVVGLGSIPLVDAGSSQNICDGQSVTLDAGPGFNSYNWSTGETTPSISVNQSGTYTLSVTNTDGCQGIDVINIAILPEPVAGFNWAPNAFNPYSINFTNTSSNGSTYAWDFNNDGVTDASTANTFYTYLAFGSYTARLIVNNQCGSDTLIQQITVTGIAEPSMHDQMQVYPNPAENKFRFSFSSEERNLSISIHDAAGRLLVSRQLTQDEIRGSSEINISEFPEGLYYIRAFNNEKTFSKIITKQ